MLTESAPPVADAAILDELAGHMRLSAGFAADQSAEVGDAFIAAVSHLEATLGLCLVPRRFVWRGRLGADGQARAPMLPVRALVGVDRILSDLAWSPPSVWSRGAGVEVDLWGRGLEARPDLAILNGANAAAVMSPSGEWEILQFQSAVPVAGGGNRWRLTRLLRGRRGTEPFIGDPTPAGARFVLLDDALAPVDSPVALRNVTLDWRIGPSRKPIGDEDYVQFSAADRAARRRPFAPARLRARRAANGDFAIDWMRRSRLDNDAWAGPDAPLEEPRERYRVRIGAYRVAETGAPDWVYDAASQAADGAVGAVEIGVAQVSDVYGPGPEARITINV